MLASMIRGILLLMSTFQVVITSLCIASGLIACNPDPAVDSDRPEDGAMDMSRPALDMMGLADRSIALDAGPSDMAIVDALVPDAQIADASQAIDAEIAYPLDDILQINHIQCKGTHNSYHTAPESAEVIMEWAFTHAPLDVQLESYGVRQIELDIHYNDAGEFEVFHIPLVDQGSTCELFEECLQIVKDWSDSNPNHHILFMLIEPKDTLDLEPIAGHYDELDAAILSVWPRERIVRPDDVRGTHPDLRTALRTDGWPTLGETRQKAMFIMLDDGDHRTGYLEDHPVLEDRVIFMRNGRNESFGAILELNDPVADGRAIDDGARDGYLVRSDADSAWNSDEDNQAKADAALATGAHFISSDFPGPTEDRSFVFDIPNGHPSRCNPVTAPPDCTASDIE